MPFWVILDHDAVMRLVTICSYLLSAVGTLLGLWVGVNEARTWDWQMSQRFIRPLRWVLFALQLGSAGIMTAALAAGLYFIGGVAGRFLGFGLGYAGLPIAYGVLVVAGAWIAYRHLPCRRND